MNYIEKKYHPVIKKLRRFWASLFGPIKISSKNPFLRIDSVTYTMLLAFISTVLMYDNDIDYFFLPISIGILFTIISKLYFRLFPFSWDEMNEKEKISYRKRMKLPLDWELKY